MTTPLPSLPLTLRPGRMRTVLLLLNFGSDGTAYVFIDRTQQPPAVRWLWNR